MYNSIEQNFKESISPKEYFQTYYLPLLRYVIVIYFIMPKFSRATSIYYPYLFTSSGLVSNSLHYIHCMIVYKYGQKSAAFHGLFKVKRSKITQGLEASQSHHIFLFLLQKVFDGEKVLRCTLSEMIFMLPLLEEEALSFTLMGPYICQFSSKIFLVCVYGIW